MDDSTVIYVVSATIVVVLAPLFMMCIGLSQAVQSMSNPKLRLRKASKQKHRHLFAAAAENHDLAGELGFEWVGAFVLKAPQELFIACWQQPNTARYFCIYSRAEFDYFEFATLYEDDRSLTTAGTKDAHTLPFPPGKWVQSFHDGDAETLWDHHVRAEEYLARRHATRLRVAADPEEFPDVVVTAIHAQMEHVRSHPLWQIRGVFWYLVRGGKSGRTVEEQDV